MKLFTVEEANRTLPLVRRIVEDVVQSHRVWREKILEFDLITSSDGPGDARGRADALEREAEAVAHEIDGFERELAALGVQLKDRRLGLVDFPSDMNGRVVLLCWRREEPEVRFWHEVDAGYAGRRPLTPSLVG